MEAQAERQVRRTRVPDWLAASIVLLGLLVLLGWWADIPRLTQIVKLWPAMQPMTSACFVLSGLALYFFANRRPHVVGTLLLPLFAIPAAILVQYWTDYRLGIDLLLFPEAVQVQENLPYPGRMPEATAIEFLLYCLFLAWPRRTSRQYRRASRLGTLGLLLAFVALAAYLLGVHDLARVGDSPSMAVHTAFGFALLFTGALWAQGDPNWLHRLFGHSSGARLAQRLLGHILGWPLLLGMSAPLIHPLVDNPDLRFALYIVMLTFVLVMVVLRFAKRLDQAEAQRNRANAALVASEAQLAGILGSTLDAVITIDEAQSIVYMNPAAEQIFGCGAAEATGTPIDRFIPARFRTDHALHVRRFGETGVTRRRMGQLAPLTALRSDQTEFPIEASISQVQVRGRKLFTVILRDVTERVQTEAVLRRSEEQLDLAVRGAGIGIWNWNIRTGEIVWSEPAYRMFAIREDEPLTLERVLTLLHPEERERTKVAIGKALAEHTEYRMDHQVVHPDGSIRWLTAMGRGNYSPDGETVSMSGIFIDITERKLAEVALKEKTETLGLALRAGHSGSFEWDARTQSFEWSDELLSLYGLRREEFGGHYQDWLARLVEEDRQIADQAMQHAVHRGDYSVNFRIRRQDTGEIRWMNGRGQLSFDANGLLGMVGINIDITEQKQQEEALRQHATLLELAHEPILVWSVAQGIVFWNRGCQILYGYSREEAQDKGPHELLKTAFPASLEKTLAALQEEGHWEGEIRQTTKAEKVLVESCRMQRFNVDGHELILEANRDITHRKQMEESLRRMNEDLEGQVQARTAELLGSKEALEKSNLALSLSNEELREFAHIAAHDLQTPLRSIAGFSQLLKKEYGDRLTPEADNWIALIVDNSRRMHALIQSVLNYSGLEADGEPLEPVDLNVLVDDWVAAMEAKLKESGAQVNRDALPVVTGHAAQLSQVLQNLIDNGLKYHGEAPPRVHISADRLGREWLIAVEDNGIGIDPKHHEKIFGVFRRLHTQQSYPGTGIGLSICRRIIRRLGGKIWLQSEPGKGSTFYFTLPDRE